MSSILTTQVPTTGTDVTDSTLYSLGMEWMSDADGSWTGIRVYTPTTQPGADYQVVGYHVTSQSTGTEIARGSATWAGPGQWQEIPFAAAAPITAGAHYVAAYVTPDYFVLTNHGADSAIVTGDLTALANGDGDALNGRIRIGADGFPDIGSGNAALYFADPIVSFGARIAIAPAVESDTALALGRRKNRALRPAVESDTALRLPGRKARAISVAVERDQAVAITTGGRLVVRPDAGVITRPSLGLVTRPYTGLVTRP